MVGLDFYSIIPYIGIKIALGTLLSNGRVDHGGSWKYGRDYSPPGKVCNRLSNNVRTFFLDDVILPAKYVVTGIRMVAIEKTAGRKGWKLQVKGTEYDSSFKLKSGTDQWFDYSNDSNSDMAYNRSRTEIGMETTTKITDTNHYIRIRATKLLFDNVPGGISYNEDKYHENKENLPLQGIELSYSAYPRFSGFVTMKLIPHKSLIFTPTTSPVGTTTETKIETTTEPPTTSPVETTTETTIETTPRSSKTTVETL